MRTFILVIYFLLLANSLIAQDEFSFNMSGEIGAIRTTSKGPYDITKSQSTSLYNKYPVMKFQSKDYYCIQATVYGNINIPFFINENWSVGSKLGVGIGMSKSLNEEEFGIYDETILFAFPGYLYFRSYHTDLDISFLLGYKYVHTSLPYNMPMGAIEFNFAYSSLRLYTSILPKKYYIEYTDGSLQESLIIHEFGLVLSIVY